MNIFDLAAKISLDSSEYEKGLSDAESKTSSFGSKLGSALGTAGKAVGTALTAATGAVTAFAGSSVSAGMSFDSAMSQVAATMGTTVDSIGELRDFAQEMGATTAFSATQSAEALNYMALAGYDAETSMSMLPNVLNLAAAGGMDLARASDMVTDASSALGLSLDETSELVDKMAMASSKSNTSVAQLGDAILTVGGTAKNLAGGTTELSAALGILADNGIKGAEGGTALRNIILSLSAPTDKAAAKMEELGVAAYDNEGNLRSLNDIFTDLNGALSTMTQGEQTDVLNTLFNKVDLKSANALLANTGEKFYELTGYIDDATGSAQAMADVQLDNLQGDITLFQSALEGAQIAISDSLTPTLREFVQFGSSAVQELGTAFREDGLSGAMDALSGILTEGIAMITGMLPDLVEAGAGMLGALLEGIVNNIDQIAQGAADIVVMLADSLAENTDKVIDGTVKVVVAIGEAIIDNLPKLADAGLRIVSSLAEYILDHVSDTEDSGESLVDSIISGITDGLPGLVEMAGQLISDFVGEVTANLPSVLESAGEIISNLIDGITEGLPGFIDTAADSIIQWVDMFGENLPKIIETGGDLIVKLAEGIIDNLPKLLERLPEVIQKMVETLVGLAGKLLEAAAKLIITLVEGIIKNLPEIGKAAGEIIGALVKGVADLGKKLLEVGKSIVDGVWQGIKGNIDAFTKNVKDFFGNIVSGVKDFLGIHSPSKLFREQIGENIALGVAEGIADKADKAVKAADTLAKDVYSRSKDWADKQTKYMELSYAEQIELWEAIQGQFIESSKQYSDAEEKIFELRQKQREEDAKSAEDYSKTISGIFDQIQAASDKYYEEVEKKTADIYNSYSLFASGIEREYIYGGDLIDALQSQMNDINDFYMGIDQLEQRGVGSAMVEELRNMGPKALNELNAILDMSEEQLDDYAMLFDAKHKIAERYAARGLEGVKASVEDQISALLGEVETNFDSAVANAEVWGSDLMSEFIDGIRSRMGELQNVLTDVAGRVESMIGFSEPDKGPLADFHTFAPDMMDLFIKGVRDSEDRLQAAVSSAFDFQPLMSAPSASGMGGWSGDMSITINTQPGQNAEEIADYVEKRIMNQFTRRKAVWA